MRLIKLGMLWTSAVVMSAAASAAVKPPWRVIYSNDGTNLLNCASPYHVQRDKILTAEIIRASVREAAVPGVGAQLLQPGTSWVPWWPSKLVPLAEHVRWFESRYGTAATAGEIRFLLAGGDIVGGFIDECHKNGVAALVSFRANDGHLQENAFLDRAKGELAGHLSRFYAEHPQYRRSPLPAADWSDRVHNWAIPEARAYKAALLGELIQTYPTLDGVEVDFQRHPWYFPIEMPMGDRVNIMTAFLKEVRAQLDAVAQKTDGKHRYLGVRVPKWPDDDNAKRGSWGSVGFDPKAWELAGVDFFDLSTNYATDLEFSVERVRAQAPEAGIYAELTHTPLTWNIGSRGKAAYGGGSGYRRSTKELLQTTAREAYLRGADGVSVFNFAYYRPFGGKLDDRGPFDEPPFDYLTALSDPVGLKNAPVCYFYRKGGDRCFSANKSDSAKFALNITPATGDGPAVLRLMVLTRGELTHGERDTAESVDRGTWQARINGNDLALARPLPQSAYPLPTPFKAGFGGAQQYLAFEVPAGLLKAGENEIVVGVQTPPQDMFLRWIELIQPAQ